VLSVMVSSRTRGSLGSTISVVKSPSRNMASSVDEARPVEAQWAEIFLKWAECSLIAVRRFPECGPRVPKVAFKGTLARAVKCTSM
jgi:hypothetical protein